MKNRNLRIIISLLLVSVLLNQFSFCLAADAAANGQSDPLVGSAKSPLGRVFGVEGSGGEIAYYSVDIYDHRPRNAAFRSVLVPGWGQIFNGQTVKGSLIMGTAFIAGYSALALRRKSQNTYNDYVSAGRANGSLYDDYKREHNQVFILGTVTALLWGYSIYDAYHNAYNPLWSTDSHRIELAADTEGAEIIWHQKF